MTVRCDSCGVESTLDNAFHLDQFHGWISKRVCPSCWYERRSKFQRLLLVGCVIAVTAGMFASYANGSPLPWAITLGVGLVSIVLATVLHEIGHAIGAMLAGMRLFNICIGALGRILIVRQVLGYDVVLRSIPFGGTVLVGWKTTHFGRLRYLVMLLCGPLTHGLWIAAAVEIARSSPEGGVIAESMWTVVYVNVGMLVLTLWPSTIWIGNDLVPTDGLQILSLPRKTDSEIEKLHVMWYYMEGLESHERGKLDEAVSWFQRGLNDHPDEWINQSGLGLVRLDTGQYEEARECFARSLQYQPLLPEHEAMLWNNLAWTDLLIGSPELVAEADRLSKQAFERLPWIAPVRGTRGSALVETGKLDEGLEMLEKAFADNAEASSKTFNACYIALALTRKGRLSEARQRLDDARRLNPKCPLLPKVEAELADTSTRTDGDA